MKHLSKANATFAYFKQTQTNISIHSSCVSAHLMYISPTFSPLLVLFWSPPATEYDI